MALGKLVLGHLGVSRQTCLLLQALSRSSCSGFGCSLGQARCSSGLFCSVTALMLRLLPGALLYILLDSVLCAAGGKGCVEPSLKSALRDAAPQRSHGLGAQMGWTGVEWSWREGVKLWPWRNRAGLLQRCRSRCRSLFLLPCSCPATLEKRRQSRSCLGKPQRCLKIRFAHSELRSAVSGGCEEPPGDGAGVPFQCPPACLIVLAGQGTWQRCFPSCCSWAAPGLAVVEVALR